MIMQLSPSSLFLDPVRMSSPLVCDKNRLTAVACKKDFVIKQEKINKYKLTLLDCIKSDHSLKDRSALNLSAWTFDRLYQSDCLDRYKSCAAQAEDIKSSLAWRKQEESGDRRRLNDRKLRRSTNDHRLKTSEDGA